MRDRKEIEDDASLNVYGKLLEVALDLRDLLLNVEAEKEEILRETKQITEAIEAGHAGAGRTVTIDHLG